LRKQGYRLRLFDCYRPLDVQKKMWKIMPNPSFVGNPYGNGSMHNKGAAVDLTLADSTGRELDLGTPFDFFGREAYHAYTNLPPDVLARRRLLKQTMTAAGFSPITSEWWHYSYSRKNYPVTNFKPECE
jgi:D-alanyl-D-alanine dipeptidase